MVAAGETVGLAEWIIFFFVTFRGESALIISEMSTFRKGIRKGQQELQNESYILHGFPLYLYNQQVAIVERCLSISHIMIEPSLANLRLPTRPQPGFHYFHAWCPL